MDKRDGGQIRLQDGIGTEVKLKCYGSIRITARANRNELILNALKIKKLFLNILKHA